MIYIFASPKNNGLRAFGLDPKITWAKILSRAAMSTKNTWQEIDQSDQVYLDISGLAQADLKKSLTSLKKRCESSFWGVIDPKGAAKDPAAFFFEGSHDYIGPSLLKGLDKKRFTKALGWNQALAGQGAAGKGAEEDAGGSRKSQKLLTGKFEGWKSVRSGTTSTFFFLFVSVSGKAHSMFADKSFTAARNRLRDVLQQALYEADGLLWMETETNSLFLVPARAANGRAAVEAGLKLALNSRVIGIEKLDLNVPLEFTVALHYGKTAFHAPGKTGGVISESVNYIFHLGTKKGEAGRLTVSGDVPEEAIPEGLMDLFSNAGVFEGIPVRQSKRFSVKS